MADTTTALATNGKAGKQLQLPTIEELRPLAFTDQWNNENKLNVLLNQQPDKAWLKKHPYANIMYVPIEIQEYLMTRIFVNWYNEVISYQVLANSVAVCVRVHYQWPIDGSMRFVDGVGAVPLQLDKDSKASDATAIKANAVQLALPAAKSYAFKDAVDTIGALFGKDLNRKAHMDYAEMLGQFDGGRPITDEQLAYVEKLITDTATDRTRFLAHTKVEQLRNLTQAKYSEAIPLLKQKLDQQKTN